ncbi:hypothetical protein ACS8FD_14590 [Psychrobacter sp. 1U2]|uniref:hypothetical protein n=1 Tax=unclassified Psychrobacter TaxID=196806 RepID=UPI003F452A05
MKPNFNEESYLTAVYNKSENFEKLISVVASTGFKTSTLIGGGIMLYYCFKIGYFPTDLSISDTFIFIALTVVFGIFYCLTLSAIKMLFDITLGLLLYVNIKVFKFKKIIVFSNIMYRKYRFNLDTVFKSIFIALWLSFMLVSNIIEVLDILSVLGIFLIAVFFYEISSIKIKEQRLNKGLGLADLEFTNKKEFLNITVFSITVLLLVFSGMKVEGFINSSMQILSLANDNVSVHVQEPYNQYLIEYGIKSSDSNFGNHYVRTDNVDVLMQGLGDNIVILFPKNSEHGVVDKVKIILPRDKVHIIDNE